MSNFKRNFHIGVVIFFMLGVVFTPDAHAGSLVSMGGTFSSANRKVVQNPWGFWVFYGRSGIPRYKYSKDGWNWGTENEIFEDKSDESSSISIWYNMKQN